MRGLINLPNILLCCIFCIINFIFNGNLTIKNNFTLLIFMSCIIISLKLSPLWKYLHVIDSIEYTTLVHK